MQNLFNGAAIWGGQNVEHGPIPRTRQMRSVMPGIAGFRVYSLGTESWTWNVQGLIVRTSRALLEADLVTGASYVDGGLYDFRTGAGTVYNNCLLNSFQPSSKIQKCWVLIGASWGLGYCQFVSGVVEWAGPTY